MIRILLLFLCSALMVCQEVSGQDIKLPVIIDTVSILNEDFQEDTVVVYTTPMETVILVAYPATVRSCYLIQCGSFIGSSHTVKNSGSYQKDSSRIFPNPARAGTAITIKPDKTPFYGKISLISSSGQLVQEVEMFGKQEEIRMSIPENVKAGIYFIRLVHNNKSIHMQKLLVQ